MRYLIPLILLGCLPTIASAEAVSFSGARAEAVLGWTDGAGLKPSLCTQGTCRPSQKKDAVVFGGSAGYDMRFGDFVVGGTAELTGTTGKGCRTYDLAASPGQSAITGRECARDSRDIFVGGRIGYVATPRTLLYALGGYANLRERIDFDGKIGGAQTNSRDHASIDGFRVGGGVEYAISPRTYIKAEYRYTDADGHAVRLRQNQVVSAIGFRF